MVWWPGTRLGAGLFFGSKLWVLALPAVWVLAVEKGRPSLSPVRHGGLGMGFALGVGLSAIIVAAYAGLGGLLIDRALTADRLRGIGLGRVPVYLAGAAYWILVNSVLEEYVWRWFVVQQFERLAGPRLAILLSAVGFTVHHVFAMRVYFGPLLVAVAAAGIFVGGAAWSWCYVRYRSIWPGYLSHALVDLAVFAIGYRLLFGLEEVTSVQCSVRRGVPRSRFEVAGARLVLGLVRSEH
jgi:membrane protease YdiL (CAAX protease family)